MKRGGSLPLLGGFFVVAGIAHFVRPGPYISIVPPSLPGPALLVALSGAAEIAGGSGVLVPATRRAAGIGLILLLIAVFPANIQMLSAAIAAGKPSWWQALLWLRLPFQPLLVWWIWRVAVRRRDRGRVVQPSDPIPRARDSLAPAPPRRGLLRESPPTPGAGDGRAP